MKTTMKSRCKCPAANGTAQRNRTKHAFTLIELVVVIATVAILTAVLLPALAGGKYPSKIINCASNFKSWTTMANVYASDDPKGMYPSFVAATSGADPTDVSTNFILNLAPYGFTIPMFFCPVRDFEFNGANAEFRNGASPPVTFPLPPIAQAIPPHHKDMSSLSDLVVWINARANNQYFAKLIYDWWVPRSSSVGGPMWPAPNSASFSTGIAPPGCPGWPSKPSDPFMGNQPIISDIAEVGGAGVTTVAAGEATIPKITQNKFNAHQYPIGTLSSINLGFGNGGVETHGVADIHWQYSGNGESDSYFY